ncbi:hypothetical protein BT96DRAFT_958818 [Gymnopus androsaceus JB14]|uniref:Uncharacterized protein n=1 Tax=Gymnopus androsaceus JB14 TaxID=1447944 RepID=A0A6A4H8I7_9AGAR|nr:hypothetical protein BT96DRAFT_958818 [Gymnopus androsaceus JB14]
MEVPNSVLDACKNSFTAADGLMAMLCHHDCVLWLVNMTSPGERQHYVFTLVERLFNHLLSWFTVGILYDWDFLKLYLPHMTFAISVFHAYGHAWPCQCIYHPQKCKGFGLTDGEGCR